MKQDHKVMKEKGICPNLLNFASVQISNVKLSTVLSVIYRDKMNTIEQASANVLMGIFI